MRTPRAGLRTARTPGLRAPGLGTTRVTVRCGARVRAARAGRTDLPGAGVRTARVDATARRGARLRRADLPRAHAGSARLRAARFDNADVRAARLRAARLRAARLRAARLRATHADVRATRLGRPRPEERLQRRQRAGVRTTRRTTRRHRAGGGPPVAGRPGRPGAGPGRVPLAVGPGDAARGADRTGRPAGHSAAPDREAGLGERQPRPGPVAEPPGGGLADPRRPGRRAGRWSARPHLCRGHRRAAPDRAGPGQVGARPALARQLRRGRPALRPGQLGRASRPVAGRAARARRAVVLRPGTAHGGLRALRASAQPARCRRRRTAAAGPGGPRRGQRPGHGGRLRAVPPESGRGARP
ncbi:pentapeptide repeat-containing protein [Micromonospora zamorensis]|uniref:pentapeptide repeat-containing protein n=1 Tax=Micromonospora zamorensis TaxID=709883 RepID=UPI00340AF7C4